MGRKKYLNYVSRYRKKHKQHQFYEKPTITYSMITTGRNMLI